MGDKKKLCVFAVLQIMNIIYSLNTVLIKQISIYWGLGGLLSPKSLFLLTLAVVILAVYALLWQRILSRVDLTVAYMCKGTVIFWGMLWAFLFFEEKITVNNIVGVIIIFFGTYLVTVNE